MRASTNAALGHDKGSWGDPDSESLALAIATLGINRHCKQCPFGLGVDPATLTGIRKLRAQLHFILEMPDYSRCAKIVSLAIMFLIAISTFAFAMETVPGIDDWYLWALIEIVVVIVFSIEYILRLFSSRRPLVFVCNAMNIIDFLAVLPFYVEIIHQSETNVDALQVFRVIRLARVFRIFKLSRYSTYMHIMTLALKQSSDAFGLLLFFICIAVIISSSLMYYAERDLPRGNGAPSPFTSIPATFYWSIVTMTTVGYGDIVPVSANGKMVACGTMLCGILIFALPISILGSNFQDVYSVHKKLKVSQNNSSETALTLRDHVEAIRKHRVELDQVLKQLRFLLQTRSEDTDFFQIWTTVDYAIVNGLLRVEQFLSRVELLNDSGSRRSSLALGRQHTVRRKREDSQDTRDTDRLLSDKKEQSVPLPGALPLLAEKKSHPPSSTQNVS